MQTAPGAAERRFALAVAVAFFLIASAVTARHEPWRDEMQAWLIARDSVSIRDLLGHLKYEGHPALWYLLLYTLQRLVVPLPALMQAAHLLIGAAAVALVARYAPFSRLQRAAFAGGYFPLYEYGVIARNYSLGVLLTAAACALVARRREHPFALALALMLLAHSIVYGTILALGFGAALLLEQCLPVTAEAAERRPRRAHMAVGLAAVVISVALAVFQLRPPPDSGFAPEWHFGVDAHRLGRTLLAFRSALLPLHPLRPRYFDALITDNHAWLGIVGDVFALVVVAIALRSLWRRPLALCFYLMATAGLLAFAYVKWAGVLRNAGFLLIALLAGFWLALDEARSSGREVPAARWSAPDVAVRSALTALLAVQVAAAGVACWLEVHYVFSYGRATAAYLTQHGLDGDLLAADPDGDAATVLGFLPKRPAYFPRGDRFGTFTVWDTARLEWPSGPERIERVREVARQDGREAVLIVGGSLPLPDSLVNAAGLRPLVAYSGPCASGENYRLYLLPALKRDQE